MVRFFRCSRLATKFSGRRALVPAVLLLLGAVASGPRLWAWRHFLQGRSELEHFHPEEARRHLSACLRFWPGHLEGQLLAARAARQLEDFEEAEEHLRQAQRLGPPSSEKLLREWALNRAAKGDLRQTESYLLPLAQEESEQALPACEALIQGYQRTYRIPEALFLLDLWQKRRPDDVRPLLLRGRLWTAFARWQRAVPDYRRVLELEPEREEAQRGLALCLTEIGQEEEAAPCWEALQRRHPADRDVQVNLARCWSHLGQGQTAQQMLQAVLQECPDHFLALHSLGKMFLDQQRPAEAETWLRRAVRLAPQDHNSHWLLYRALLQQDKTAEAERLLDRTKRLELRWERLTRIIQHELPSRPHDAALQAELGIFLLEMGYETAGRNWLLSALQEDPHCASARAALQGAEASAAASGNGP
jgi:tetratricopeptide (TPR) repeat protein